MSGTSVLLGSGCTWRTAGADDAWGDAPGGTVVANDNQGLSLPARADGPLGLTSGDDSLGRLVLPRGVAIEGEGVYVLSADGARVWRWNALTQTLDALDHVGLQGLPAGHDAAGAEPRRFRKASAIAVLRGALYVADPEARRVQVFDVHTLALLRIHDGVEALDLAAGAHAVYILCRCSGRVLAATPGRDTLDVVVDLASERLADKPYLAERAQGWDRIAVDRAGRIYLRHRGDAGVALDVFDLARCEPSASCIDERILDGAAVRDRFDVPPATMDAAGVLTLPERLLDPCGLCVALAPGVPRWEVGERLYVDDPQDRSLQVFLPDGRLRHRFGPYDAAGIACAADDAQAWSPADVADLQGTAWVLDGRHQRVYVHRMGADTLRRAFAATAAAERVWQRIAIDASGCVLLWDGSTAIVDRFEPNGRALGTLALSAVRALFARVRATREPSQRRESVLITRSGTRPRPARAAPSWPLACYRADGVWTSEWLDSASPDCVWHAVELSLAALPAGSSVVVRTRTCNRKQTAAEVAASLDGLARSGSWSVARPLVGAPQPEPGAATAVQTDLLVLSAPGRYLQLQIELTGSGATTPVVQGLRLRYPRESLLQYLPHVYSSHPEQRQFLDRYLSMMQATWAQIEYRLDTFERYADPDSVPPEAMAYLASWLDLRLEGTWSAEQNRRLLQAMPGLRSKWGTVQGLREWVRVYLANIASVDPRELEALDVPGIVEGFVERRALQLNTRGATLGSAQALWSPAVERRFQLGVFDRIGEVELVSVGDPQVDVYRHHAHAFRIFVPAMLVRTAEAEAMLRRAIEMHKPAHATYELVLVEPRLRIGVQSTIELDTVIAAPPAGPLPCATDTGAPSRPLHGRLGYDRALASARADDEPDRSGPLARPLA